MANQCKFCSAPIGWGKRPDGKPQPLNMDNTPHYCVNRNRAQYTPQGQPQQPQPQQQQQVIQTQKAPAELEAIMLTQTEIMRKLNHIQAQLVTIQSALLNYKPISTPPASELEPAGPEHPQA